MIDWRLPGLRVAVPFVLGTAWAVREPPPLALGVVLLALALALGGLAGRSLGLVALAMLSAGLRTLPAGDLPPGLDADRPVEVRGRLDPPWREAYFGWRARLRVETVHQGERVVAWPVWLAVRLGSEPPAVSGRGVVLKGYLRRAPPLLNDPPLPPGPWQLFVKSSRLVAGEGRVAELRGVLRLRQSVLELLERAPPSDGIRLARALVLGDSSRLDRDLLLGLRRVGLGHLLAVSGLHVGIVAWLLWWLGAPLPSSWRRTAPVVGALLYLGLAGPRPALLRAAAMAIFASRSLAVERRPQSVNSLAWALTGILLLDPAAVRDLGFVLSAAATGGIVVLGPQVETRLAVLPRRWRRAVSASVGAQLAALPWTLTHFHVFTPLTVVLNLVAVPWTALMLALSVGWIGLAGCRPPAGSAMIPLLDLVAAPFGWLGSIPPARLGILVTSCGWWWALLITLGLGVAALGHRRAARVAGGALAALLLAQPRSSDGLEVSMIDVGQGESILLRDGRRAALVDGGGWHRLDIAQRVLVPTLAERGLRRLDAVVLTHPDRDHCRGLLEITSYLPVSEVWAVSGLPITGCGAALRTRSGLRWRPLWRGRRMALGRWCLQVLHPPPGGQGGGNERSLVIRARAGRYAILLTGDLGPRGERELLAAPTTTELEAGVLKVAHHGSASSTSARFLAAVAPSLALVSAGRQNAYGHPSLEVLDRLAARGVTVRRTDRHGMIRLAWPEAVNSPREPPDRDCRSYR